MSANAKSQTTTSTQGLNDSEHETDVLYQKLGDRWFAFSIVNDEVLMSPVSEEKVVEVKQNNAPTARLTSYEL